MPDRAVVANWKMNLPPEGIDRYLDALNGADSSSATLVVAPPYPYIERVSARLREGLSTAAQNCADHEKGAYTGEVAPAMVREAGARYVILGHSERRTLYGESDAVVARKLALAFATGLAPVLCIGEDLRARDAGKVATVLADQIRAAASAGLEGAEEIVIAYEPVWAIGTGRNASGTMVGETVAHIREALERFWPARFTAGAPILYGGSVTPDNVADLVRHGRIDGFLVGGASLDSGKFLAIHAAIR
ncbi:MAG TPA: triose-phosphate isomerase [Thermoanaerobaculia bacterium]|nr:triose-phosphate isomerase [Thermoanaerobaculia bacterium]